MKILIVEDEVRLAESLCAILENEGYEVDTCFDGESGLDYAETGVYDLLILDIMMPKKDGIEVLRTLRQQQDTVPILLLTAKGTVPDKVLGLDSGADDYLPKPFDTGELLARVRALSRRAAGQVNVSQLAMGDLIFQPDSYELSCGSKKIALTQREGALLEYLMRNRDQVISKEQILDKIWGFDSEAEHNHVEVYVSFLRKKLLSLEANVQIRTLRGMGYQMEELVPDTEGDRDK